MRLRHVCKRCVEQYMHLLPAWELFTVWCICMFALSGRCLEQFQCQYLHKLCCRYVFWKRAEYIMQLMSSWTIFIIEGVRLHDLPGWNLESSQCQCMHFLFKWHIFWKQHEHCLYCMCCWDSLQPDGGDSVLCMPRWNDKQLSTNFLYSMPCRDVRWYQSKQFMHCLRWWDI